MLEGLKHHVRVIHSKIREAAKRGHPLAKLLHPKEARSPEWPRVERAFKASHPHCAACGGTDTIQIHHMMPFHKDPSLELNPTNLISLCMAKYECHIRIGHGGNFHFYNPNVRRDAADVMLNPQKRAIIEQAAKNARLVNEPGGA